MSRRLFIKILIALGLEAYFPKLARAQRLDEPHTPRDDYAPLTDINYLRQVVTKDSRSSRMLMWQAYESRPYQVEWQLVGEESAHFAQVAKNDSIYSCALEGLKAASLYKYRITDGERATLWRDLRTSGDGAFQMLIFADSQCEHYETWQRTADTAHELYPDAELVVVNGDLVDNGEADYQWRAWHDASSKLLANRTLAPVMGNHECYGVDWLNALPTGYLNQFALPDKQYFYSFDYCAAHFFMLNTQFDELETFKPKLQAEQEYWFRRDAANVNRPWKIVFMHKDIYDYGQDKFNDIAERFMDLFEELAIDLVFTGHLHTYRNRGELRGTTYILCGRAGDQKYVERHSTIDHVTYPNLRTEPESFIALDVTAKELHLTARTIDGQIIDDFTLTKGLIK